MKQFVAIMLLTLTFSVFGEGYDSYLLWMVGDDVGTAVTVDGRVLDDSGNYSAGVYALDAGGNRVGGEGEAGYLALFDSPSDSTLGKIVGGDFNISDFGPTYAGIPSPSLLSIPRDSLTFYIELLQDGKVLGHSSQGLAYSAVSEYITNGSDLDPAETWRVSTFVSAGIIPEPNSAMLMLLGLATMALRRRKLAKRV